MAKITKLEQKTFEGKPSGFKVTFEDGRTGNLQEKESDKGLRVGDTVNVVEIPYTSKAGKQSTLYGVRLMQQGAAQNTPPPSPNPPTPPQRPQINVGTGKSCQELKADAATRIAEKVIDAFFNDKIESAQVEEKQKYFTRLLWSEIDEIFSPK